MNVLVTGGAGFLGSHVVDRLRDAGHQASALDDLSTGRRANLAADVPFSEADVRDAAALDAAFGRIKPDVVAHFAAQVDVRRSVSEPDLDAEVNVVGSLRVIEAAARHGVRKIVYASSAAVFGEPRHLPVDETHPREPISAYGISKGVVEDYLRVTAAGAGIAWTALRFANAYGPRQNGLGEAGVVAIFAQRMRRGEACALYGDGAQTRDFVYAGDCADAVVLSLDCGDGEVLVVGTGVETSIRVLHDEMARLSGHHQAALTAPRRPGEIERMCFDASRAGAILGWRPATSLSEGLARTLRQSAADS